MGPILGKNVPPPRLGSGGRDIEDGGGRRGSEPLLRVLERAYGNPVDIEYTVNLDQEGRFVVNLLQCRPLYTGSRNGKVEIPPVPEEQVLFSLQDSSVGDSASRRIDVVVQIDPRAYYGYPYGQKYRAAEAVGRINRYYRG